MDLIAYCQPFVPPEWIAAHGLRPQWLRPQAAGGDSAAATRRGVCPVAAALLDAACQGLTVAALVLTTTCDQMRYAAAALEALGKFPVFLMHVPRTWQTAAAREFYSEELRRLGRFLIRCGGTPPAAEGLRAVMIRYEQARAELRRCREEMSACEFAEAVAGVRGDLPETVATSPQRAHATAPRNGSIPLALLGGPLPPSDHRLLELIEDAGGRVVLDGSESGERTLPASPDFERMHADPLAELAHAYFDAIPDVFRRPNNLLYVWLRQEVARRGVRGLLVRRYLWCDLWHAELPRLRQESAVPVLEWDAVGDDPACGLPRFAEGGLSQSSRDIGRLEAFLETLR
jgi:benzoyl-CoA reductase/2-hydroxyglutaryl-CoA dehydratase subunit BcrC/BadD/HgdB